VFIGADPASTYAGAATTPHQLDNPGSRLQLLINVERNDGVRDFIEVDVENAC